MSTYAFAALFITAGILLAVQHSYWRGRLDKAQGDADVL